MSEPRSDQPAALRCGACRREVEDDSKLWPEVTFFEDGRAAMRLLCQECHENPATPPAEPEARRPEPAEA